MKIGLLGGTFNPVHSGHLILAEEISANLGLDKVIFVPSFEPPHKDASGIISARHRLAMLKLALRGRRDLSVSELELRRGGKSYTIDTVRSLRKRYPHDELFIIIGSDLLDGLREWKDFQGLNRLARFAVAQRPGYRLNRKLPDNALSFVVRPIDISSADIRGRIKKGLPVRYLMPESVYAYIMSRKLYK